MTGLEEQNTDARVTIDVSASGVDLAGLPNAPTGIGVVAGPGGTATATWGYSPLSEGSAPTGFHVYVGTPTVSYASAVATATYAPALTFFSASLSGLTSGSTYQVAVRSYNATGTETNTSIATFVASTSGPTPVTNVSATLLA